MDLLRWILLGFGLLLITAVWWHGRRNRPAHEESLLAIARRRWRKRTAEATRDEGRDPVDLDLPEREEPDFGFDPAELDELFDRGRESTEAPIGREPSAQRATSSAAGTRPSAGSDRRAEPAPRGEMPRGDSPPAASTSTPPTQRGVPHEQTEVDGQEKFEGPDTNREPRTEPEPDRASAQDPAPAPRGAGDAPHAEASQDAPAADNGPKDTSANARGPADRSAGESPATQAPVDRGPDRAEADERIVVLYVVAPRGERLDGTSLYRAFTALGLEYGELDIFHGHDESGQKVYSVANATEPGTFDPATMADLQTPGIALFARLPGPQSPTRTFDAMAATAQRLAEMLGARALDERQSTLTRQTEQAMRDELLEYEHRRARLR